jgi:hypothetical protein
MALFRRVDGFAFQTYYRLGRPAGAVSAGFAGKAGVPVKDGIKGTD